MHVIQVDAPLTPAKYHEHLLFPDAIHYLILYSFRNNTLLKIPGNIAHYLARANSTQ